MTDILTYFFSFIINDVIFQRVLQKGEQFIVYGRIAMFIVRNAFYH